jgi:ABC-type transport system involved in multi-copper enzyme maturation permease subunit
MPEESAVEQTETDTRRAVDPRANPKTNAADGASRASEAAREREPAVANVAREVAEPSAGSEARASSPARVLAIARNTFREAVRDRVLYNLVLFVLLLTGGAVFLGELSAAQEAKIIVDMGLSAMLLFGVFIAIFVGVGLVYKEIERRTIYAIFSKPVGRGEFLLGKYLGLCLTLAVNVFVMGAGVSLALLYVRGGFDPLALRIWPAVALIYFELMIIVAVALLFSSFSSPALSALLTFFVFVIGHFSADLQALASSVGSAPARLLFAGVYYLLPNLSNYAYTTAASHGATPATANFFAALAYALAYIAVLLAASTLIFKRRNFK